MDRDEDQPLDDQPFYSWFGMLVPKTWDAKNTATRDNFILKNL